MRSILLAGLFIAAPVMAADVGVSVNVGQPGFFGEINVGEVPHPALVYTRPMVIHRDPAFAGQPMYLHVPPGHERHWSRHCAEYHACGRPVYFVRDDWYNREYVPRHQRHDHDHDHDHDQDHHN
jgi:hypothetical protein